MIYILLVIAALVVLVLLTTGFPSVSSGVFLVGTPIVVVTAGLGAKFVRRRNRAARAKTS